MPLSLAVMHTQRINNMIIRKLILIVIIFSFIPKLWAQDYENESRGENQRIFALYTGTFQSKAGLMIGLIKNKNGLYLNGRYGKFPRTSKQETIYDDHWINERYSITIGYVKQINGFIDIYGGLGYGYLGFVYLVDDFNANEWIVYINDWGHDSKSFHVTDRGVESEIGVLFHYKYFYACIGVTALNIKHINPIFGVGFGFQF
jgi:hypothetical protein